MASASWQEAEKQWQHTHVLEDQVDILVVVCFQHIEQANDVVMAVRIQLLQKHDFL
jgi:hypothetical protein